MEISEIWEAATGGVLWEKVLLEISQNSQENTCPRVSFLMKFDRCFPVDLAKFLMTPFLTEHLWATTSEIYFGFL